MCFIYYFSFMLLFFFFCNRFFCVFLLEIIHHVSLFNLHMHKNSYFSHFSLVLCCFIALVSALPAHPHHIYHHMSMVLLENRHAYRYYIEFRLLHYIRCSYLLFGVPYIVIYARKYIFFSFVFGWYETNISFRINDQP